MEPSKPCFKCHEVKPLSAFYAHAMMADGRLNKCKLCARRDVTAHREANLERIREYDRQRAKRPENVARRSAYVKRDPIKSSAWILFASAVKSGKIERQPCEVCGAVKTDAHHDDYLKPLDVRWLCRKHHRLHHVRMAEAAK